jgi:tRNA nucleotidyltransferase (CCA-adding enzyme)
LTINAIAFDPLTGMVEDPWGGCDDLRAHRLREVDPDTFGEDPLRALRVPQLAARLEFLVTPGLLALCAAMPLQDLPAERVGGELRKLLMRASRPSWGLDEGLCAAVWRRLHPALSTLDWEAARGAVDRAADLGCRRWPRGGPRAEALMVGALLHGVEPAMLEGLLDRLDVHSQGGFALRRAVLLAVQHQRDLPVQASDGALRLAARMAAPGGGLGLWLSLAWAVRGDASFAELLSRTDALGVALGVPPPLVTGRDLVALGFAPGPGMGALLERLYRRQLEEGLREATPLLAEAAAAATGRGDGRAP